LIENIEKLRDSKWFSNLTTIIIIVYASVLGFKTLGDVSTEYSALWHIVDYGVNLYFVFEIAVKMVAEKKFLNFFKSKWNIFDFIIVTITLLPLESSGYAAVARLMRVFKILRLFTARPELKAILDMLIKAIPAIIDIVILMFIIFYIYAIIGSFVFSELPSGLWRDFLISMLTLFRVLTFEDWTDVMYEAMEVHPWSWIYFISFIIIAAFVFFNLFVAVIIGEMQKLQEQDMKNDLEEDHKKIDLILEELQSLRAEVKELKKQ